MDEDKLTKKENKETGGLFKLNDDDESEKYIKEMHKLADKEKFMNRLVASVAGIVLVSVFLFAILMNAPFMKSKTETADTKAVSKSAAINPAVDSSSTKNDAVKVVDTPTKIYEYLNIEANRTAVLKKAVDLNKGSQKGVTVYLLSEILRLNTVDVPAGTSSVEQFMKALTAMDWKKNTDFTKLEKGDICFTTDRPDKAGVPSHTYIFMGWIEDGKTDYANICDGQIDEYANMLHKRNISITTTQKDKFSFFLRK